MMFSEDFFFQVLIFITGCASRVDYCATCRSLIFSLWCQLIQYSYQLVLFSFASPGALLGQLCRGASLSHHLPLTWCPTPATRSSDPHFLLHHTLDDLPPRCECGQTPTPPPAPQSGWVPPTLWVWSQDLQQVVRHPTGCSYHAPDPHHQTYSTFLLHLNL